MPTATRILTHCNAGALATAGYGTALGVIRAAAEQGTRPSRPTRRAVPARVAAHRLGTRARRRAVHRDHRQHGRPLCGTAAIDAVVVGADRIAANGDVANKIGTYRWRCSPTHHGVPFYVAAPLSTIDLATADGRRDPYRGARRPTRSPILAPTRLAPEGASVWNPAFDVTPCASVYFGEDRHPMRRGNFVLLCHAARKGAKARRRSSASRVPVPRARTIFPEPR